MTFPDAATARLHINGLEFLHRDSGGAIVLLSYHPRGSATWHWAVRLIRSRGRPGRARSRTGQWNDWYWLPFGFRLLVGQQDWHKRLSA